MSATPAHRPELPDAIEAHTRLLNENKALKSQLRHLQAQVDKLEEEKRRLLTRQYGPSSEKDPTHGADAPVQRTGSHRGTRRRR